MSSVMPSRRTVVRTTAWSVPAITIATAAPAFAASEQPTYQTVTKEFTYAATIGQVKVVVEARVPLVAPRGTDLDPTTTTSTVTIPDQTRQLLQLLLGGPAQVGGTSLSTSTLSGALAGTTTANLAIARVPFPSSGNLVTVATGASASGLTVPTNATPGTVVITMGEPQSTLVGYNASGGQTGTYPSNLTKIAGNDYTLATFQVV